MWSVLYWFRKLRATCFIPAYSRLTFNLLVSVRCTKVIERHTFPQKRNTWTTGSRYQHNSRFLFTYKLLHSNDRLLEIRYYTASPFHLTTFQIRFNTSTRRLSPLVVVLHIQTSGDRSNARVKSDARLVATTCQWAILHPGESAVVVDFPSDLYEGTSTVMSCHVRTYHDNFNLCALCLIF